MACLLTGLAANVANAQYVADNSVGVGTQTATDVRSFGSITAERIPNSSLAIRAMFAAVTWIPAALIGGSIGYAIMPHTSNGDDPGLLQFVHGALVGGAIGAGFGAAAPGLETECSFATRFGRSLLGSAAGASIGFLFRGDSKLLAVPILSVTGASLAEWRC